MIKISLSRKGVGKLCTFGFKDVGVVLSELGKMANRFAISGSGYKDGHRKGINVIRGSNVILIDCDEPSQAEAVERKLQHYDYVKVPSASNLKHNYKWHFIVPTQEPLSIYPAAFKWQVEQFFRQVGIDDSMIDTTGSYDISRQFAPATIGMTEEEANERSEVHIEDLCAPIEEPPEELCNVALKSINIAITGKEVEELPADHLWYEGKAITYTDAREAILKAGQGVIVSGFGCPNNNAAHTSDVKTGYGFAYVNNAGNSIVKCTGNACKKEPYFMIPESVDKVEFNNLDHVYTPVDPVRFADKMKEVLIEYNSKFVVSPAMMDVFNAYCSTFNSIVRDNKKPSSKAKRYIIPLATGSAKTTAAKLYLGANKASGLLVVRTAMDAIKAVRDINMFAGGVIARCTYSIDAKNNRPDTPERVAKDELINYPVIVLTHSMFQKLHDNQIHLEKYSMYGTEPREAVIIDERIDLKREESFDNQEVEEAIKIMREADSNNILQSYLQSLDNLNDLIFTHNKENVGKSRFTMWKEPMRDFMQQGSRLFPELITILKSGEFRLTNKPKIRGLRNKDSEAFIVEKSIIDLLQRMYFVINGNILLSKEGAKTNVSRVEDFSLVFGSTAILDATANVNKSYEVYMQYQQDTTVMFHKPEIRNYKNATLHIAKGFKQSKSALYHEPKKINGTGAMVDTVKLYLELIYPVVEQDAHMLVVVHKDALATFKEQCRMDNITFINWGNHAGSNQWNYYNKATIIGWFRLPQYLYANQINAGAKSYLNYEASEAGYDADVRSLGDSAIADDMVQFLNRIRSRIAIDEEGNHDPVDYYLFSDDTTRSKNIINRMVKEFKDMAVVDWSVAPATALKKRRPKAEERADNIIAILKSEAQSKSDVMAEDIRTRLGTTKAAFKNTIATEYMQRELAHFNIKYTRLERVSGKPSVFDLSEAIHL